MRSMSTVEAAGEADRHLDTLRDWGQSCIRAATRYAVHLKLQANTDRDTRIQRPHETNPVGQ